MKTKKKRIKIPSSEKDSTIEYTFDNGLKVNGTFEQLTSVAKAMGLKLVELKTPSRRGYYFSESKGIVKISEMNQYHLRRALLKRGKEYLLEIYKKEDSISEFLKKFRGLEKDSIVSELYLELESRK
jgi:hypothetical protein